MKPLVDLTHTISEGMTVFRGHGYTKIGLIRRHVPDGREVRELSMSCHAGTHIDAPRHFIYGGATVDQIDVSLLVGECAVNDWTVDGSKLFTAERTMIRTDWSKRIGGEDFYTESPFLDEKTVDFIVAQGVVKVLLLDFPSPDKPLSNDCPNHKKLLGAGIYIVEYLTNVAALGDANKCEVFIAPLKIEGAEAAPCRVLARPL